MAEVPAVLEVLHSAMVSFGIMSRKTHPRSIQEGDLLALAERWKVKIPSGARMDAIVRELHAKSVLINGLNSSYTMDGTMLGESSMDSRHIYFDPNPKAPEVKPLEKNYFGLPNYALQQTPMGLIYRGRKPMTQQRDDDDDSATGAARRRDHEADERNQANREVVELASKKSNVVAQRKVASALLAIASNPATATHFVLQGGIDAIIKLSFDASDQDTLMLCAKCISQAADTSANRRPMLDKQVRLGRREMLM
jgi:hypothetical protein